MTAIQKYEELGFTNDFMFSRIMQDKKICKPFLEMILGIKIDHIEYLESQKTIDLKVDAKSVRLDIFVDDGKTVYNCEMQTFLMIFYAEKKPAFTDLLKTLIDSIIPLIHFIE